MNSSVSDSESSCKREIFEEIFHSEIRLERQPCKGK
jgi:hypothetical protein